MYTPNINFLVNLHPLHKQELVQKLTDYILLNAFSVENSGLYHGKVGMSLALFSAGRYLKDESLEERAGDLLEEALLSKISDIGFENGLAGIGYILAYLIKDEYIEADFQELFEASFNTIITESKNIKCELDESIQRLRINLFLTKVQEISYRTLDTTDVIEYLFKETEKTLLYHLQSFTEISQTTSKREVICLLKEYLKIIFLCNFNSHSAEVIDAYVQLYNRGLIASDYELGYYLEKIDKKCLYAQTTLLNLKYSPAYKYVSSLRENLDLLQIIDYIPKEACHQKFELLQELERNLSILIPQHTAIAGYGYGISRLICYLTQPKTLLL